MSDSKEQEYFNIACWLKDKINYHKKSSYNKIKRMQVNQGEVWYFDLGYNIGTEKNKCRPVLIVSSNKFNRSDKVVVICLTDAQGKVNERNLPYQDSWYLLYSDTTDDTKKISPNRIIPKNNRIYSFLEKDSMLQCEEIRIVHKVRLDNDRKSIGVIDNEDLIKAKQKFLRLYDF